MLPSGMQWEGHDAAAKPRAARAESSSEAASLNGQVSIRTRTRNRPAETKVLFRKKALTPILAGSICGGVLAIAWIAALVWYLLRRRRKGPDAPKETGQTEPYIIPRDPATLQEYKKPGEPVSTQ